MKNPKRSPLFVISLAFATALLWLAPFHRGFAADPAKPPPPDLYGTVQSKDGQPINNASVFIYTAGPRVGTSPI